MTQVYTLPTFQEARAFLIDQHEGTLPALERAQGEHHTCWVFGWDQRDCIKLICMLPTPYGMALAITRVTWSELENAVCDLLEETIKEAVEACEHEADRQQIVAGVV